MKKEVVLTKPYEYADAIIKEFNKISGQYSASELFNDWLEAQFCCLNSITGNPDNHYKEWLINAHENHTQEQANVYNEVFRLLSEGLNKTRQDILGIVYMNIGYSKGKRAVGQCFTPNHIADLMAKLVENESEFDSGEQKRIADFCCGSGTLAIGGAENELSKGKTLNDFTVYGADIDITCVKMALIQFEILGYDATVVRQNVLEQDTPSIFFTTKHMLKEYGPEYLNYHTNKTWKLVYDVNKEIEKSA